MPAPVNLDEELYPWDLEPAEDEPDWGEIQELREMGAGLAPANPYEDE